MRPTVKAVIVVAVSGAALALLYEYAINPVIVKPIEKKVEEVIK